MATKIRLMRLGKIRAPYYRIVVADSRTKRDGKVIETIGKYHPKEDPSIIEVDSERAQYWLRVGAQPTEPVLALLKLTGDYQRSKGQAAESKVKVAPPKPDRKARYEAEAAQAFELKSEQEKANKAEKAEKKAKKAEKAAKKTQESASHTQEKPNEVKPADAPAEA